MLRKACTFSYRIICVDSALTALLIAFKCIASLQAARHLNEAHYPVTGYEPRIHVVERLSYEFEVV